MTTELEQRIEELKIDLERLRENFEPGPCNLTLRDDLIASYSDLYKSYNGIRPRWIDWSESSDLDILVALDNLHREGELQREREEEQDRLWEERRQQEEQMVERIKREGVGELPEPEWKQQLRALA